MCRGVTLLSIAFMCCSGSLFSGKWPTSSVIYMMIQLLGDISNRISHRVAHAYTLVDGHHGSNDQTPTDNPQSMTLEWDWLVQWHINRQLPAELMAAVMRLWKLGVSRLAVCGKILTSRQLRDLSITSDRRQPGQIYSGRDLTFVFYACFNRFQDKGSHNAIGNCISCS